MDNIKSMENKDYQNFKIWKMTGRKLRLLAVQLDIPMTQLIDDMVTKETERCSKIFQENDLEN